MFFNIWQSLFEETGQESSGLGSDLEVLTPVEEDLDLPSAEEDEEDELEDEEPEEEEEEAKAEPEVSSRVSLKAVQEKYPNLLKEFPGLKDVFYREAAFAKVFPSVEDARTAAEESEALSNLREDVLTGSGQALIEAIRDDGKLEHFSDKILPTLQKVDQGMYLRAITPVLENVLKNTYRTAQGQGNQNLLNAALHLSLFLFNDFEIAEGKKSIIPKVDEAVADERKAFREEQFGTFRNTVSRDLLSQAHQKISDKLDSSGVLSQLVKDAIIEKTFAEVDRQLAADRDHLRNMDNLWRKARQEPGNAVKTRLINTYLARAAAIIPRVRAKFVTEAMQGKATGARQKQQKQETTQSRQDAGSSGRPSRNGTAPTSAKNVNWNKTSDLDFLMDRVVSK